MWNRTQYKRKQISWRNGKWCPGRNGDRKMAMNMQVRKHKSIKYNNKGQSPRGWNCEKVLGRVEGKGQLRSGLTKHNLFGYLWSAPSVGSRHMKYSLLLPVTQGLFWCRPSHQWDLLPWKHPANVTQTRVRRKTNNKDTKGIISDKGSKENKHNKDTFLTL